MTPRGLECELWLLALSWCAGYRFLWDLFEPILIEPGHVVGDPGEGVDQCRTRC